MPTFWYKALGHEDSAAEGTIAASNRREALQRLIARGQNPVELREHSDGPSATDIQLSFGRRSVRLATFTRQLATLSATGSPIIKGLAVISEQTKDPNAKRVLTDVSEAVQGGSTFADALAKHPRVFPNLMTNMVRVGEMGGTLDEQLLKLSELYESEEALKGEVQAALAYPALVLLLGVLSAVILVAFFIPRLESMFDTAGQALPAPTVILLAASHFITGHYIVLIIAVALVVLAGRSALRKPQIRLAFDEFVLRVPWFGTLLKNMEVARFTRLLGTLTQAGVSIVEALGIVQPVIQNKAVAETVRQMITGISSGDRLADLMRESNIFPPLSVQMVATGEETGHLDQLLLRLADAYDRETTASTKVIMSLLAPLLILLVAGFVGFILIAMILPIFQLSTVMS